MIKTTTKVFGIDEIQLFPISEDSSTAYTLGDAVELPGAKSLEVTIDIEEKNLSGNEIILDVVSKVRKIKFNAAFAKLSLDVLQAALGGNLVQSGETPSQTATFSLQNGNKTGYFQLAAKISNVDEGSMFINIMKCKINANPIAARENDFATYSLSGSGVYTTKKFERNSNTAELLMDIVINEGNEELAACIN